MPIRHVVLVATRMQYVNALEALAAFGMTSSESLLVTPGAVLHSDSVSKDLWGCTAAYSYGGDIGWFSRWAGRSRVGRASRALDHVRRFRELIPSHLGCVDLVTGGLHDKRYRHVANTIDVHRLVVVDDGTATVELARTLREGERKSRLDALADRLLGLKTAYPQSGTFFTSYDVDLPPNWTHHKNTYAQLRQRLSATASTNEAVFVGGPFVRSGWMKLDEYVALVAEAAHYVKAPLVYVPHRHEEDDVIEAIAKYVTPHVWRPPSALEVAMVDEQRIPKEVIGFLSSVLPNVHYLFGERCHVTALRVDFPGAPPQRHQATERIYEYFEELQRTGWFKLVDLR